LIAANAVADVETIAARPSAAAITQKRMPTLVPKAVITAARRPCMRAFRVTRAISTPGVMTTMAATARNGPTCIVR
jgi:hypothetical protein